MMRILFVGSDNLNTCLPGETECAFVNGFKEAERTPEGCGIAFPSLEEAVDRFRPDFAVIGVPNYRKNLPGQECMLLQRGIPLLIQKFRLRDFEDYDRICLCQRETGTPAFIGEFYRLTPLAVTVRSLLEKGVIGTLEYIRWECGINGEICGWESAYENLALEDLAFHHFSVMESLFGLRLASVCARTASPRKGLPAKGTVAAVLLQAACGPLVEYSVDWHHALLQTDFFGHIRLEGDRGGIEVRENKVTLLPWEGTAVRVPLIEPVYRTGLEQLAAYYSGQISEPPVTLEEFTPVMETIRAALESVASGRVVLLPEGRRTG